MMHFILPSIFLIQVVFACNTNHLRRINEDAKIGDFPFYASILLRTTDGKEPVDFFLCGGAIIKDRWILTAASCKFKLSKDTDQFIIMAGQHRMGHNDEFVQIKNVSLVIVPSAYSNSSGGPEQIKQEDIALLKLESPLLLNQRVQTIGLSETWAVPTVTRDYTTCGFLNDSTKKEVLQKAKVSVIPSEVCPDIVTSILLHDQQSISVCTGPADTTSCFTGIGHPLIDEKNGLVGILIWCQLPCAPNAATAVYTQVTSYKEWINDWLIHI